MTSTDDRIPAPRDMRGATASERAELARLLYDRLGPRILELGYRYHAGSTVEAEELVAETFARVLVALARFKGGSSYSTWVYRIAMNVIADSLRRRRPEPLEIEPPGRLPDAAAELEQRERAAAVNRALRSLRPEHRMVLTLVAMENMSSREAAACLGVPEGTLWSRYSRARLALARRLDQLGIS
jgi:RNA polymerase sigma-70 factor (ECF subfamily)